MIKCNVCGHDNPLGRVHCVQCGTKIDLSKVVPEGMAAGKGAVVIKKTRSGSGGGQSLGKTIIKVVDMVLLAALAIAIALMWQVPTVKESASDAAGALTAKAKFDSLVASHQTGKVQSEEFTEQEVNSYINDAQSPRHFKYPEDTKGVFCSRFVKYQFQFSAAGNEATAFALGEIRLKDMKKQVVVRASGTLVGKPGNYQLKLTKLSIGKLPLHALPFGDKLVDAAVGKFFPLQVFDQEWNLLKSAREVQFADGKAAITVGVAAQ